MRSIRVFVSSPSDLKSERQAISQLVDEFNKDPIFRERYKFIAFLYEEMTPSFFGEIPQDVVNQQMLPASEADLVVCMFWSRFGSPLKGSEINPDTGTLYQSGTEYEFYDAYRAYKANRKPVLTLYRCIRTPPEVIADNPAEIDQKKQDQYAQRDKIDTFFRRIEGVNATVDGLYKQFLTPDDLINELRKDWRTIVARWIEEEDAAKDRARDPKRVLIERVTRLIPILVVLLILAGILIYTIIPKIPPIDAGAFNVAIAGFIPDPSSGLSEADTQNLSDGFYKSFQAQIDGIKSELPLAVGIWSPEQVGLIQGATPDERARNAQKLAADFKKNQNLQADIIVYGIVTKQTDPDTNAVEIAVLPEFYVASPSPELSDVLGRFTMGAVLSVPNPQILPALSAALSDRSRILSSVTEGLVLNTVKPAQYETAYTAFNDALNVGDPAASGKELVRVLMANAHVGEYNQISAVGGTATDIKKLGSLLADVQLEFSTARDLNSDFSRAYVGLAGAKYLQVIGPVSASQDWNAIKESELQAIESLLQEALAVKDRPESADVPTKVAFGLGQVQVLRYLRGDAAAWDKAKSYFDQVIADYGNGANLRVKELAAQAMGYLGLLDQQKSQYGQSKAEYTAAINLTDLDAQRQLFSRAILQMMFDQARAAGNVTVASKAADDFFALKMLPKDKAIMMYHKGKMLSENNQDQASLTAYQLGVNQIDQSGIGGDPSLMTDADKKLAAELWAVIGDQYSILNQNDLAIPAYQRALLLDPTNYSQLTQLITDMQATSIPMTVVPIANPESFAPTTTPRSVTPTNDVNTSAATEMSTSSGEAHG